MGIVYGRYITNNSRVENHLFWQNYTPTGPKSRWNIWWDHSFANNGGNIVGISRHNGRYSICIHNILNRIKHMYIYISYSIYEIIYNKHMI